MSNDANETLHYPSPRIQEDEGGPKMDYMKSGRGILNFLIMGFLFLGFVCAVSLKLSSAKLVDACSQTTVKINVRASTVAYMFFVVLALVIFGFLALLNIFSMAMLSNIRAMLSKMMIIYSKKAQEMERYIFNDWNQLVATKLVFLIEALAIFSTNLFLPPPTRQMKSRRIAGLVMVLVFILFIVSSTQCASEHKLSQSNSADLCAIIRAGGPGASCFFGYMAIISMVIFAAMTFNE